MIKWVSLWILMLSMVGLAQGGVLRDPTRPPLVIPQAEGNAYGINITSILYSASRHVAVVNGKYVKEGDVVQDLKVVKIHPEAIVFQSEKEEFSIPVHAQVKHKVINKVASYDQK